MRADLHKDEGNRALIVILTLALLCILKETEAHVKVQERIFNDNSILGFSCLKILSSESLQTLPQTSQQLHLLRLGVSQGVHTGFAELVTASLAHPVMIQVGITTVVALHMSQHRIGVLLLETGILAGAL